MKFKYKYVIHCFREDNKLVFYDDHVPADIVNTDMYDLIHLFIEKSGLVGKISVYDQFNNLRYQTEFCYGLEPWKMYVIDKIR